MLLYTACMNHVWRYFPSGIFPIEITDHMPIFITFPVVSAYRAEYFIKYFRDHSKKCLDWFEWSLSYYVDTFDVGNDIKNGVYLFLENLYDVFHFCCLIRKENV